MQDDFEKEIASIVAQTIGNIIRDEAYIEHSVHEKTFDTKGANYFGDLVEVDIKGLTVNGEKEINLFVKKCKSADYLKPFVTLSEFYVTETFVYRELSEIFTKIQNEANIPIDQRYKMVKSYPTTHSNVIVLENLAKKGYKTLHRMDVITLKFAELALHQLAKFHGLSFALRKEMPQYFASKVETLPVKVHWGDAWITYANGIINITIDNIDEDTKKKVIDFLPTFHAKFPKYAGECDPNSSCCLRHGDMKLTNILYKEVDSEIVEVIPIDYQLTKYGPPILDFILLIFSSTDRQFRKQHLSYLKDLYHDSLRKFLQYFEIEVDEVYSRNKFDVEFKEKFDYALMIAVFMYPLYYIPENSPDLGDDTSKNRHKLDSKFQKRFQEVLEEWEELNL